MFVSIYGLVSSPWLLATANSRWVNRKKNDSVCCREKHEKALDDLDEDDDKEIANSSFGQTGGRTMVEIQRELYNPQVLVFSGFFLW